MTRAVAPDNIRLDEPKFAAVKDDMMFRFSRLIVGCVATAFAMWCAVLLHADLQLISFSPLWKSWNLVTLAIALTLMNYALRVERWRWYLSILGHSIPPGFSALTYLAGFAFTLSPGKLGELYRARYYINIGVPLRDVMAAFWAERLVDLGALLILALLVLRRFPKYQGLVWAATIIIGITAVLLLSLPAGSLAGFIKSRRLPRLVAEVAENALSSFVAARSLFLLRPMVVGLLAALAAWGLEGLGLGIFGSIFSPSHNDASAVVGIYAVAVLLGAVSFLPGGLGSTEAVMSALLASQGYSLVAAVMATLACRITTLWLGVSLGWLAVTMLRYGSQRESSVWPSEP